MRASVITLGLLATWIWATIASADEKAVCTDAYVAAQTLRNEHRLLNARDQLRTCARQECASQMRGEMLKDCTTWLAQVEAVLPSVVFEVRDSSGNDLSAVHLMVDGQALADRLDGTALSVDPGEHTFRFETAGQPALERKLVIREGDKGRRERVVFGVAAPAPPTVATQVAPSPAAPTAPPEDGGHGRRVLGLVSGGAGLVGLAVGGIFGGLTFSSWGSVNSECPGHAGCSAQATSNHANAVTFGTVSTAGFIAGGVLLAGGVTLYFTAPGDRSPSVGIQMAPGGLGVAGRF